MASEIIMPKAGMAMETGTVMQWFKDVGEYVEAGEPLLEIETDKVSMEVEAETSGYVLSILRQPGDVVPVIETIGYLGEKGETPPAEEVGGDSPEEAGEDRAEQAGDKSRGGGGGEPDRSQRKEPDRPAQHEQPAETKPAGDESGRVPATPAARRRAGELGVELSRVAATGPHGEIKLRDVEAATGEAATSEAATADRPESSRASTLAKKVAADEGLNLADIEGSGPGGRVVRADVVKALAGMRHSQPGESGPEERSAMSGMRRTISTRMLESHLTMPPVTLNARVDVTDLLAFRKQLNEDSSQKYSLNDFILKATARAVRTHESVRTAIDGDEIVVRRSVNIGMAVAVEHGLMVPVLRDVDRLPLSELSAQARDLAEKVRAGKLGPDQLKGGTFTVTNLGMFGIHSFTPIINPPQSAILGVNSAERELTMDDEGEFHNRSVMMLSLTIDHRVIDGAQGAQFLSTLRELLEKPVSILV